MNVVDKFNKLKDAYLKMLNFKKIDFKDLYKHDNELNREIVRILLGVDIDKSMPYIDDITSLERLLAEYDISINNFYYQSYMGYLRLFYVYNGFIMDLNISQNIITLMESIKDMQEEFNSYFINKEEMPEFLFYKSTNLFRPQMIEFLSDYMRDNDLKKVVKDYQKSSDYNANNFSLDIMKKTYSDTVDIIDNFLENGLVKIYRGVGSKSNELNNAYSWTLNIDVAKFFATRSIHSEENKDDMCVYEAIVDKNAILGVIVDNEEEVLINPELINNYEIRKVDFNKDKMYEMPKERKFLLDEYKLIEEEFEDEADLEDEEIKISPALLKLLNL